MFKLLTELAKQKVKHEYRRRRTIVMLSGLILVLIVGTIGLLPSYVLLNARQNEARESVKVMNSSMEKDEPDLQAWLKSINHKLKLLSPVLDTDRPSEIVEKILDIRPASINMNSFSWKKASGKITLSINGVALDRQALIMFENRINSTGKFSEVVLPISNLAKDKNINFQINFSLIKTP